MNAARQSRRHFPSIVDSIETLTMKLTERNCEMSNEDEMKVGKISLVMHGWFKEAKTSGLPDETGLYLVFGGIPLENGNAHIKHLIYIGQAQDIKDRIADHEKKPKFKDKLAEGESLYYYCVYLKNKDLDESEGAMIKYFNRYADIINEKCTESFTSKYDVINVTLTGKIPSVLSKHTSFCISPRAGE